ncbi:MAG: hypothetical protein SGBAC_005479 [Bacillariaceae sp.]
MRVEHTESTSSVRLLIILCFCILARQTSCFTAPLLTTKSSALNAASARTVVAVTREDGKNSKLLKTIRGDPELGSTTDLLDLPCIEHSYGADIDILAPTLKSKDWDYVAVTSPEAAKVLASAWDSVRDNPLPVVAVGAATEKTLEGFEIAVCFTPSKATAETLAEELELKGTSTSLLYPASARAKKTLQNGLETRGVEVTRLNTYDTVTAKWSEEQKVASEEVQIACFASPSSIKGWLQNTNENKDVIAACIGETSASACRSHGWDESKIFCPKKPGIDGWVQAIKAAAASIAVAHS